MLFYLYNKVATRGTIMTNFLLTWNPKRYNWKSRRGLWHILQGGQYPVLSWSCGNTKQISLGDTCYLMRLGLAPKGIIGKGIVVATPYTDKHWNVEKAQLGKVACFIDVSIKELLDPDRAPFPVQSKIPGNWTPQASGMRISDEVAESLSLLWDEFMRQNA